MWIKDQLSSTRFGRTTIYHLPEGKIDDELPRRLVGMTNGYGEILVVDNIAYAGGKIWDVNGTTRNKNLLQNFSRPRNSKIIEKDSFALIPGTSDNIRMISTPSPKGCVVPLAINPVVFLQVTENGVLLSNGTVFIDSELFETEAEAFQIFRDGDSWILNLTIELRYSYATLYPGLYRLQRAINPFVCRVSNLPVAPQDNDVYVDNHTRIWAEEEKVIFENYSGIDRVNVKDLQFARIHGDKKAYIPVSIIKRELEVETWSFLTEI